MSELEAARFKLRVTSELVKFKVAVVEQRMKEGGHGGLSPEELIMIRRSKTESAESLVTDILKIRSRNLLTTMRNALQSRFGWLSQR